MAPFTPQREQSATPGRAASQPLRSRAYSVTLSACGHCWPSFGARGGTLSECRFAGKTALVTGASRGIGAVVAILLAERGADVGINFRSKGSRAAQIAAQIRTLGRKALLIQADITAAGDVVDMAKAVQTNFAGLDVLVLNASGG